MSQAPQKVIFELFDDYCPKTCENFRQLCCGFENKELKGNTKVGYANSLFHRVVKGQFIQGGDISKVVGDDSISYSIYDGEFADESFQVKHDEPGLLGMCRKDDQSNTNECQFYVTTTAPLSFMDNKNVVFGRLVSGLRTFKMIDQIHCANEQPDQEVQITSCGVYKG